MSPGDGTGWGAAHRASSTRGLKSVLVESVCRYQSNVFLSLKSVLVESVCRYQSNVFLRQDTSISMPCN